MTKAPRVLIHLGQLYFHYAGPFKNQEAVREYAHDCFASGEWSESDKPIVQYESVYLLAH